MTVRCIAVDVGTSVVKAVAFDGPAVVAIARRGVAVVRPEPGHAEQDMDAVWQAVVEVVREAGDESGTVDVVAVTAQGDGLWPVDRDGRPTGPAVLWNDARAADVIRRWERTGLLGQIYHATGSMSFAGLANALLAWFDDHDPERLRSAAAVLTCGGYVMARLTGELVVDSSDASAPFLDIGDGQWSDDLVDAFGLGSLRHLLPEVLPDDDRSRPLSSGAAQALGLPPGTPVVLAPYDVVSCTLGAGAVHPGAGALMLGTTLCATAIVGRDSPVTPPAAGLRVRSGLPGRDLRVLPTSAGVGVLDWMAGLLDVGDPVGLTGLAREARPGSGGLVVLPYLSPSGERAPFLDVDARGTIVGASFDLGRHHLARATFEGLACVVRECLDSLGTPVEEVVVSGGGARNHWWRQVLADVTGRVVLATADEEVGPRGAQVAAFVALGASTDHEAAVKELVTRGQTVVPSADRAASEVSYRRWLAVRDAARPVWRESRS